MAILFLVPARGGSKGIIGKNLRTVGGVPIVGRATRTARMTSDLLSEPSRVICSTDDPAIAEVARTWGAEIPFMRPEILAQDDTSSMDVVFHALDNILGEYDTIVLLQPTSPLVEPEDILGAIQLHKKTGSPVVSVCTSDHPPEWTFRIGTDGRILHSSIKDQHSRRQDCEKSYRLNGAIYIASTQFLKEQKTFLAEETMAFIMPPERSIDVDHETDLIYADAVLGQRQIAPISIAGRLVGPGHPCFIIAEAGVNHNGDLNMALQLVDAAAKAGVDAVKFQTFRAEKVIADGAPLAAYQRNGASFESSQLEMVRKLELSFEAFRKVNTRCAERGILFLSTPFDNESTDFLHDLQIPAFKIGSGDLTHHDHLRYIAGKRRPIILSTGMATMEEVDSAISVIRGAGVEEIALLHCVSSYPAPPEDCHLRVITALANRFSVPSGWSDHTLGLHISLAAIALGANVLEKHFTLDRSLPGPDHAASLQPDELVALVMQARQVESALGFGDKAMRSSEADTARVARRSLHSARDLSSGHRLTVGDITAMRPGTGIPADRIQEILGRTLRKSIPVGTMLDLRDIE